MSGGVKTALAEAMEEADDLPDADQAVQAALFDDAEGAGAADAPSPLSAAFEPRRKGGRPPGARNRRTQAVADWLLRQHRHPLAVMAEAYTMSPEDLAARIGLRKAHVDQEGPDGKAVKVWAYSNDLLMDVLKLQMRMAESVAGYVAQKQPQAVQLSGAAGLAVHISGVSLPARGLPPGGGPVIEGQAMAVRLPVMSDEGSRTDGEDPELIEELP